MSNIPFVSLKHIQINPALVRQLPRKLAYYHLALPLAVDNGQITVALAHTGNPLALEILERLLGAEIVLVHATSAEIKAALDTVWRGNQTNPSDILTWGTTDQYTDAAHEVGLQLSQLFNVNVNKLYGSDLENILLLTQQDDYMLTVASAASSDSLMPFIRKGGTPVLLLLGNSLRTGIVPFRRILLSLRGHSPDLSALELTIPLVNHDEADMAVIAVTGIRQQEISRLGRFNHGLNALLDPQQEPAQHLAECTTRLTEAGIHGYLKLCQGDPVQQIVTEYIKGQYDLLVITSEAYGDFVQQVIETLQQQRVKANLAVLVVRPTVPV